MRILAHLLLLIISMNPANGASASAQNGLLQALKQRDVEAVRAALDAGADPNLPAEFGRTPLHIAVRESSAAVELLLSRGAKPDALDQDGRAPLHLSDAESAAILLAHQANFLVLDKQGNSVLHTAAESDARLSQLLIEAGLPTDARNNFGVTPLQCLVGYSPRIHRCSFHGRGCGWHLLEQGRRANALSNCAPPSRPMV